MDQMPGGVVTDSWAPKGEMACGKGTASSGQLEMGPGAQTSGLAGHAIRVRLCPATTGVGKIVPMETIDGAEKRPWGGEQRQPSRLGGRQEAGHSDGAGRRPCRPHAKVGELLRRIVANSLDCSVAATSDEEQRLHGGSSSGEERTKGRAK